MNLNILELKRKNSSGDEMGPRAFIAAVTFWFSMSLLLTVLIAQKAFSFDIFELGLWGSLGSILLAGLAMIVGSIAFLTTNKPSLSFLGVLVVCAGAGSFCGVFTHLKGWDFVAVPTLITAMILVIMSIMGIFVGLVHPKLMEGWGPYLLVMLSFIMVISFIDMILAFAGIARPVGLVDYFVVAVSSVVIAYIWAQALKMPRTMDNAIDAGGALLIYAVQIWLWINKIKK